MAHEMAELLKSRARRALERWVRRYDPEHSEELLDPMRFYVEAAEVYAAVDAGKYLATGQVLIELHTDDPVNR
jgi:spatacsin